MEIADKYLSALEQSNTLLRKLIIIQLCITGVPQADIRTIIGGNMNDINALAKLIRKPNKKRSTD